MRMLAVIVMARLQIPTWPLILLLIKASGEITAGTGHGAGAGHGVGAGVRHEVNGFFCFLSCIKYRPR